MTTTRRPTVIGPVTGANPPWGAPAVDLDALGYLVEEYHLEGTLVGCQLAAGTEPTVDGRWQVEEFGEAPYRTRILVVRPVDPARFNGTVVAGWQNVSAGYESKAPTGGEVFDGYAWVGVSAQEVGIHGFPMGLERFAGRGARPLVEQDPERYGELHHPGDPGAFDLFTQAARALGPERAGAVDPLGGLDVRRIVAMGGSQSAMRLAAYLNGVHPTTRVIDGFLLSVWEGRAPRPEEGAMPLGVRTSIRTDTDTPVLVVNSEFEAPHLAQIPITDTDDLRVWEVAGTPHGLAHGRGDHPDARGRVVNRLTYRPVHEAALRRAAAVAGRRRRRAVAAPDRVRRRRASDDPARRPRQRPGRNPAARAGGADARVPGRRVRHRARPALRVGPSVRPRAAPGAVSRSGHLRAPLGRGGRRTGRSRGAASGGRPGHEGPRRRRRSAPHLTAVA